MSTGKLIGATIGLICGVAIVGLYLASGNTHIPAAAAIASCLLGALLGAALGAYVGSSDLGS